MDMTWTKPVRRSDGSDFKFQGISVLADLRRAHDLEDGDEVTIIVEFGGSEEKITKPLTSGGEVAIDKPLRERILDYAAANPTSTIRYTLVLDLKNIEYLSYQECEKAVQDGEEKVRDALKDDEARRLRLEAAPPKPQSRIVSLRVYTRNYDVVAERLALANGVCEGCDSKAPFDRRSNGQPYLEVHHIKPLGEDGDDTVDNTIALCPNCHREAHYG